MPLSHSLLFSPRSWRVLFTLLSGGIMAAWMIGLSLLAWNRRRYPLLSTVQPDPAPETRLPTLSILVPACNEAATIEPAMKSLLALDYPCLEIVAVDDRSTDETGRILDRLAARNPRLRVVHLTTLPEGWLGKNHALQVAGEEATGDWLLFTDADVVYKRSALRRSVAYAEAHGIDHLAVSPHCESHGFWERLFLSYFSLMYSFRFRIWEVEDPRKSAYVGFGAFNLVRTTAYQRIGAHHALAMETVDDMKLGKLLKRSGARAAVLQGPDLLSVRWMIGLRGVINGLTKNAFAAYEFSPVRACGGVLGLLFSTLFPFVALCALSGPARWMSLGAVFAMLTGASAMRRTSGANFAFGLVYPLAALLLAYIILRSAWRTYRQGGIVWRGAHYSLEELRKGIV